jgi:hypothetical protein
MVYQVYIAKEVGRLAREAAIFTGIGEELEVSYLSNPLAHAHGGVRPI